MDSVLFLLNSPPSSPHTTRAFDLALELHTQGKSVSVFLLQDAVLSGLETNGAHSRVGRILGAGIPLYALGEDLRMRGFADSKLWYGVRVADYAQLVDLFDTHTRVVGAL